MRRVYSWSDEMGVPDFSFPSGVPVVDLTSESFIDAPHGTSSGAPTGSSAGPPLAPAASKFHARLGSEEHIHNTINNLSYDDLMSCAFSGDDNAISLALFGRPSLRVTRGFPARSSQGHIPTDHADSIRHSQGETLNGTGNDLAER